MPFKHYTNRKRKRNWKFNGKFNWNLFLNYYEDDIWTGPAIYVLDIFVERLFYLTGAHVHFKPAYAPICETMDTIMKHVRAGTWKIFVLAE